MTLPRIDPAQIQAIVTFLAPFLPYLTAGVTEAAKTLGKKAAEVGSDAAWKKAQDLWARLKKRSNPKLDAKAQVVAVDPADQDEIGSLVAALHKHLQADSELAGELASLLGHDESVQTVIARNRSWVEKVVQKGPGRKHVEADEDSVISDVRQES